MADVLNIAFELDGSQDVKLTGFNIGATVNYNFTCLDPNNLPHPLDLTASAIVFTVSSPRASATPIISRQATITVAVNGTCVVPIASGDTVISGTPLPAGVYFFDVWAEDVSGNRIDLGHGTVPLYPAIRLPGAPITPLPSQEPLAQGPQGPTGPAGPGSIIGDTVTGGTAKSVLFIDSLGHLAQDNSNFQYTTNTHTLGVNQIGSLSTSPLTMSSGSDSSTVDAFKFNTTVNYADGSGNTIGLYNQGTPFGGLFVLTFPSNTFGILSSTGYDLALQSGAGISVFAPSGNVTFTSGVHDMAFATDGTLKIDGASVVSYSPSTPGNWAGSPATLADAIDRIAALLYYLTGDTPIA